VCVCVTGSVAVGTPRDGQDPHRIRADHRDDQSLQIDRNWRPAGRGVGPPRFGASLLVERQLFAQEYVFSREARPGGQCQPDQGYEVTMRCLACLSRFDAR
jgi:hypothetical protein